ncbi:MAG: hypothetical protein HZA54_18290 [Planctomycetes bacterium]|nr:hypothetical protein [Planctomycetota bacterium]
MQPAFAGPAGPAAPPPDPLAVPAPPRFDPLPSPSPFHWVAEPDAAPHLARAFVGREERLRERAAVHAFKDNRVRALFFVPDGAGGRWLVKWFKPGGWVRALQARCGRGPARREWENQRTLAALGVPASSSVALAERRDGTGGGEAFLFIREIPDARSLREALRDPVAEPAARARRALLARVAALTRRLHDAGFDHADLHAGNFLLSGPATADAPLTLIDLHRGGRRFRVGPLLRIHRLVRLADSIASVLTKSDALRLLRGYFAAPGNGADAGPVGELPPRRAARRVLALAAAFRRRLLARRTARCLRSSSGFRVRTGSAGRLYRVRSVSEEEVRGAWARHGALGTREPAAFLKWLPDRRLSRQRMAEELPAGGTVTREVVVKEFRPVSWLDRVKRFLGHSPARRAWVAAHGLAVRGRPTPRALALIEEPRGSWGGASALILEWLPEAQPADRRVAARLAPPAGASVAERRALIAALADAVRGLHRAGVHHHDLKANNLLLAAATSPGAAAPPPGAGAIAAPAAAASSASSAAPPRGALTVWFLDLDRVAFSRRVSARAKRKALAQLSASMPAAATRADRLRFFRRYAVGDPDFADHRAALRRIQELTAARRHLWPPRRDAAPPGG